MLMIITLPVSTETAGGDSRAGVSNSKLRVIAATVILLKGHTLKLLLTSSGRLDVGGLQARSVPLTGS